MGRDVFTRNGYVRNVCNQEDGMNALNVRYFPDDLHREMKVAAAKEGKTLKDWLIEAVKEKLAREKDPK